MAGYPGHPYIWTLMQYGHIDHRSRAIMDVIARMSADTEEGITPCFMSLNTIARATNISVRTVRNRLAELKKRKLVFETSRTGRSTCRYINWKLVNEIHWEADRQEKTDRSEQKFFLPHDTEVVPAQLEEESTEVQHAHTPHNGRQTVPGTPANRAGDLGKPCRGPRQTVPPTNNNTSNTTTKDLTRKKKTWSSDDDRALDDELSSASEEDESSRTSTPPTNKKEASPCKEKSESSEYPRRFQDWWIHYPKKRAKGAAFRMFDSHLRRIERECDLSAEEALQFMIDAVKRYAVSVAEEDPQWIAHPTTWLNQHRYFDELEEDSSADDPEEDAPYELTVSKPKPPQFWRDLIVDLEQQLERATDLDERCTLEDSIKWARSEIEEVQPD